MSPFDQGVMHLANWIGNAVLPVLAGLIIALGVVEFSRGRPAGRYFVGALAALMGSGLLRFAEVLCSQNQGADQYFAALLALTNVVGNVLMPMFAVVQIVLAVLAWGGVLERSFTSHWMHHTFAAMGALMVSGLLRLFEKFVTG